MRTHRQGKRIPLCDKKSKPLPVFWGGVGVGCLKSTKFPAMQTLPLKIPSQWNGVGNQTEELRLQLFGHPSISFLVHLWACPPKAARFWLTWAGNDPQCYGRPPRKSKGV